MKEKILVICGSYDEFATFYEKIKAAYPDCEPEYIGQETQLIGATNCKIVLCGDYVNSEVYQSRLYKFITRLAEAREIKTIYWIAEK